MGGSKVREEGLTKVGSLGVQSVEVPRQLVLLQQCQ